MRIASQCGKREESFVALRLAKLAWVYREIHHEMVLILENIRKELLSPLHKVTAIFLQRQIAIGPRATKGGLYECY